MFTVTEIDENESPMLRRLLDRLVLLDRLEFSIVQEKRFIRRRIAIALDSPEGFGARLGHVVAARDANCGDKR